MLNIYHFISYLTNTNLRIPNENFCEKSDFEPGLLFLRERGLFPNLIFFIFLPNPYTRMCVSTIGSFSLFREIVKHHCETPVESWFFGISLIWDFSVYFNIHKG